MNDETRAALHAIYDELPKIKCRGLCHHECTNIGFFKPEFEHLTQITGRRPEMDAQSERCNYLNPLNRCSVYDDRPWVCRAYGVDPTMPCPYGCVAERVLTPFESRDFINRIANLLGSREVVFNTTPQVLFQMLRKQGCPKQEARHLAKVLTATKIFP